MTPPRDNQGRPTRLLTVRVTEDEYAALVRRAAEETLERGERVTVSDLVREAIARPTD